MGLIMGKATVDVDRLGIESIKLARHVHVKNYELGRLHHDFMRLGAEFIDINELLMFANAKHSIFGCFIMKQFDRSGKFYFSTFFCTTWALLSSDDDTIAAYCFSIVDVDRSNVLHIMEIKMMLVSLWDFQPPQKILDALNHLGNGKDGIITIAEFVLFFRHFPYIIAPVLKLRDLLQSVLVYSEWWKRLARRRRKHFGSSPPFDILDFPSCDYIAESVRLLYSHASAPPNQLGQWQSIQASKPHKDAHQLPFEIRAEYQPPTLPVARHKRKKKKVTGNKKLIAKSTFGDQIEVDDDDIDDDGASLSSSQYMSTVLDDGSGDRERADEIFSPSSHLPQLRNLPFMRPGSLQPPLLPDEKPPLDEEAARSGQLLLRLGGSPLSRLRERQERTKQQALQVHELLVSAHTTTVEAIAAEKARQEKRAQEERLRLQENERREAQHRQEELQYFTELAATLTEPLTEPESSDATISSKIVPPVGASSRSNCALSPTLDMISPIKSTEDSNTTQLGEETCQDLELSTLVVAVEASLPCNRFFPVPNPIESAKIQFQNSKAFQEIDDEIHARVPKSSQQVNSKDCSDELSGPTGNPRSQTNPKFKYLSLSGQAAVFPSD